MKQKPDPTTLLIYATFILMLCFPFVMLFLQYMGYLPITDSVYLMRGSLL